MSVADTAITVTEVVGNLARLGAQAAPVARFIASFIPGLSPVVAAVDLALPWMAKIQAAAPAVAAAIEKGRPVLDAIQKATPEVLPALKNVYAIAVNADPARVETALAPEDVSDHQAVAYAADVVFVRGWTAEETQRWWDRAQGQA